MIRLLRAEAERQAPRVDTDPREFRERLSSVAFVNGYYALQFSVIGEGGQAQRFEPSILVTPFLQGRKYFFRLRRLLQCRCLRIMAILDHGQVPSQLFEQTDKFCGFLLS